jgi:hypothetical protein
MAIRMAAGTMRRARESIHGLVTTMLIEEEFNGRRAKGDTQEIRDYNSDAWIYGNYNIPEEEEK